MATQKKQGTGGKRKEDDAEDDAKDEREAVPAKAQTAKAQTAKAKPPWTAYAIVGGVCAVIGWSLLKTDGDGKTKEGGAAGSGSAALPADGGLGMDDLVVGTGAEAAKGDKVTVHYAGTLTNGTEFDSSKKHNQPFDFQIGRGE